VGKLFGAIAGNAVAVDQTDGLRTTFASGAVIHLRPSGNAPELRIYTESDTPEAPAYSRTRHWASWPLSLIYPMIAPQNQQCCNAHDQDAVQSWRETIVLCERGSNDS
jgi:hypothetical protein